MRRGFRPPRGPIGRGRGAIRGTGRGAIRGTGRGIGRPTNNLSQITFSDYSSSESESDNIPIIKTKPVNNQNSKFNIQQDSTDEYSDSFGEKPIRTIGANLYSDNDYSDDFAAENQVVIENPPPSDLNQKTQTKKMQNHNFPADNNTDRDFNNTTLVSNQNVEQNNNNNQINSNNDNININNNINNNNYNNTINSLNNNINNNNNNQNTNLESQGQIQDREKTDLDKQEENTNQLTPSPQNLLDATDVPLFRIIWKKSGRSKNNIQMVLNNEVLFHSKESKTDIGKCHIICSDDNIDRFSKSYLGSLKKSQSLTRFTLFTPQGEQYQTNEGEALGLSFYVPKEIKSFGVRAFRIAIPKKEPYFPSTKSMNLSKIAQKNIQSDDFTIYSSKLPELLPGPILKLQFGNVHVISSVKNFILEDENQNVIYMIYKSSSGMCSVKIAPPITPLIAFCISIAVITSKK